MATLEKGRDQQCWKEAEDLIKRVFSPPNDAEVLYVDRDLLTTVLCVKLEKIKELKKINNPIFSK